MNHESATLCLMTKVKSAIVAGLMALVSFAEGQTTKYQYGALSAKLSAGVVVYSWHADRYVADFQKTEEFMNIQQFCTKLKYTSSQPGGKCTSYINILDALGNHGWKPITLARPDPDEPTIYFYRETR